MFNSRLFSEAKPRRGLLVAGLFFNILAAIMVVAQAYIMASVVDAVFLQGQTLPQVWPQMLTLAGAILVRSVAVGAGETAARRTGISIKQDLRNRLARHLAVLGPARLQAERSGELASTATEGVELLQSYFGEYLPALIQAAVLPIVILATVFPLDLLTAIVLLLTAPLIPFFMVLIGKLAEENTNRQWKTLGRLSAHFLDTLQGLTTLKLFGRSRQQADAIRDTSKQYADATLGVLRIAFLSALALELLATLSTAIVAVEIGLRLLYGGIAFQQALFILILAPEFYQPLRNLGARFHSGMSGVEAATRIYQILDQPVRVPGSAPAPRVLEGITFKSISFQHDDADHVLLEDVSFKLQPSSLTALVGPSGAGKSTLMNLLLGFLQPQAGQVLVNDIDLALIDPDAWRAQLAWVPQKPYLFQDSLAANLRLAKPQASAEELWTALEEAALAETVRALPQGLETPIGERGARLSGGQSQRLALARAYLKDAPLLLLDEPTAHLDAHTEAAVAAALDTWRRNRIVLAIAHRPATALLADQVLLVKDGQVALATPGSSETSFSALEGAAG